MSKITPEELAAALRATPGKKQAPQSGNIIGVDVNKTIDDQCHLMISIASVMQTLSKRCMKILHHITE
jgi:hypothetical protein